MKDVLKNLPPLVDTVTVKVANVTKYDDHQVEIREADTNLLMVVHPISRTCVFR